MKKTKGKSLRIIALMLSLIMVFGIMPMSAIAEDISNDNTGVGPVPKDWILSLDNLQVTAIHGDTSKGEPIALSFDSELGVFSGALANYTDLAMYNDTDISIALGELPEGFTAQLKSTTGEKITDFSQGVASTTGEMVKKMGEYSFTVSLQNGEITEDYTLKLTKEISQGFSNLVFVGNPDFDQSVYFFGKPEGTLFQLDENGNRTGAIGLSEDCFNYAVYCSALTDSVKPAGNTSIKIYQNFRYPNHKTSIYINDAALFENIPTCMAMAMKWSGSGVKLTEGSTVMRVEMKVNETEVINTTITFVHQDTVESEFLIPTLEALDTSALIWPDDSKKVEKLYFLFTGMGEGEKAKISSELQEKLALAYEMMRNDRVPKTLEVTNKASKLVYAEGQEFDPTGTELLATYADGSQRRITTGYTISPDKALTDETEVIYTYNTVSCTQPISLVSLGLEGEGTEENPYKLSCADDMLSLYNCVASGQNTEGKYFEMTANITLPETWSPIGITIDGTNNINKGANMYAFRGIIDGKNYTITIPEGGLPLLGYVHGAEVRNLNIYGKKIAGYGLVNNFEGVGLSGSAIIIDNVTLKSGSSTLKSGLLGANITTNGFAGCSAGFVATIKNCTIEENVVIGYEKNQSMIGSIAGRMQGTVENCVSYATVYGINYVGGIIGTRDNAMGLCQISDCTFNGKVEASGHSVGGILGGGYTNGTAPNGGIPSVTDCTAGGTIIGADRVGGIMGSESFVLQSWSPITFKRNSFTGKVQAVDGEYVGGIIGYIASLNKHSIYSANYFSSNCGTDRGIGFVEYVDTSCPTHETESGATYINTSEKLPGVSGISQINLSRNDDPLGADSVMLTYSDDNKEPIAVELTYSGECKTSYLIGEELDLSGLSFTALYHTGESRAISSNEIEVSGYNSGKRGEQSVSLIYGKVSAQLDVMVLKPGADKITVYITLLGDTNHGSASTDVHTLADGNLTTWIERVAVEVDLNATVIDVLEKAVEGTGMTIANAGGNYVSAITKDGVKLAEVNNGANSGWMYTINGVRSRNGVAQQYLENGDEIIFHYSDDYTKETAIGNDDDVTRLGKLNQLLAALPEAADLDLTDFAAVTDAMNIYNSLSDVGKTSVLKDKTDKLNALIQKMSELRNESLLPTDDIYSTTGSLAADKLRGNEKFGMEWLVIGLSRASRVSGFNAEAYYNSVVSMVKSNGSSMLNDVKSTENSRTILALTAIGKDVTNVGGYNLLAPLSNLEYLKMQGINGPIWALIAFDSHSYTIPRCTQGTQATRENIINEILDAQLADGGWDLSADTADADMTAMAIQALAPYYSGNSQVRAAVDKAIDCLSKLQNQDGGYASWGTTNSESCSQVIVALTSLGINPAADARFIKNSNSVIDALLGFYINGGGFAHIVSGGIDSMATEQGYYALTAYNRLLTGKSSLYNMNDVLITANTETPKIDEAAQKNITISDVNQNKVTISGADSVLSEDMELEANIITSGELYEKALKNLSDGEITIYALYLLKNNVEVQPNGRITISIPVPNDYDDEKCEVALINNDGSMTDISAELIDGKLVFEVNGMGVFAIYHSVKQQSQAIDAADDDLPPNTNDNGMVALLPITLLSLVIIMTIKAKYSAGHNLK